jgi:hypothetical protein
MMGWDTLADEQMWAGDVTVITASGLRRNGFHVIRGEALAGCNG